MKLETRSNYTQYLTIRYEDVQQVQGAPKLHSVILLPGSELSLSHHSVSKPFPVGEHWKSTCVSKANEGISGSGLRGSFNHIFSALIEIFQH